MKITDIRPQKYHQTRMSIFIDGKYAFSMDGIDYLKIGLHVGDEITENDLNHIKEQVLYEKVKQAALHYASFAKRTTAEVRKALLGKGYDNEMAERAIRFLSEYQYVDDAKYKESYIKYARETKKYGKERIRMVLRQKGIETVTEDFDTDEEETSERDQLRILIQNKLSKVMELNEKEKNRIIGFCLRRGYSLSDVFEILKEEV